MAWFFLISGILLITASIKNRQDDLFDLLKDDFSGQDNFVYWVMAIAVLAAVGQVRSIRPVTDAFLGLVILVIILASYRNGRDLFSDFVQQIKAGTQ